MYGYCIEILINIKIEGKYLLLSNWVDWKGEEYNET